jgi:hypothetical protein
MDQQVDNIAGNPSDTDEELDNPFQAGGELRRKADYIITNSRISRTELQIADPDECVVSTNAGIVVRFEQLYMEVYSSIYSNFCSSYMFVGISTRILTNMLFQYCSAICYNKAYST